MAKKKSKTTAETEMIEYAIESAIKPGDFIGYNEGWSFISGLEKVSEQIDGVADKKPLQAVELIETFIAVCYEKAEEIDDSSGSFGMFVEELFCSWVNDRQKADFDPKETIARLLSWMDDDDYGFTYQLERSVSRVLSPQGLNEFAAAIRLRFEEALEGAWQNFLKHPDEFSHKELIKYIPKQQRIERCKGSKQSKR